MTMEWPIIPCDHCGSRMVSWVTTTDGDRLCAESSTSCALRLDYQPAADPDDWWSA